MHWKKPRDKARSELNRYSGNGEIVEEAEKDDDAGTRRKTSR